MPVLIVVLRVNTIANYVDFDATYQNIYKIMILSKQLYFNEKQVPGREAPHSSPNLGCTPRSSFSIKSIEKAKTEIIILTGGNHRCFLVCNAADHCHQLPSARKCNYQEKYTPLTTHALWRRAKCVHIPVYVAIVFQPTPNPARRAGMHKSSGSRSWSCV